MQSLSWQQQLAQAIKTPQELLDYVGLEADSIGYSNKAIQKFPIRVPHSFANRIKHNDPNDPILRQIFPYLAEDDDMPGYINDPLAENNFQPVQGLLHKYRSRVLSITTGACAIHCRYCFRRHFPYQEATSYKMHWEQGLDYIKNDHSIDEIILSGGDPLVLSDSRLDELISSISGIQHIERIRIHTRIPVVLPNRLTETLINKIIRYGKTIIFVTHINHANELNEQVEESIKILHKFNIMVLNQSVLLKGINDSAITLISLSKKLVEFNIVPYYLHMLDPVSGA
ncbi:MAG: EF-P beta-lysylation protein EpmB, partial [Proteobacteria bacterium]|nr:EF-P beta-lysylation protein EpmB [Pseudomonadota bacterium]